MFSPNSCSLGGKGSLAWNWQEYYTQRKKIEEEGGTVVLVDMIDQPVPNSVPISNELFQGKYPDGTYFVLYCHSGGSSGYLQKELSKEYPQYKIVNMLGGIGLYEEEK